MCEAKGGGGGGGGGALVVSVICPYRVTRSPRLLKGLSPQSAEGPDPVPYRRSLTLFILLAAWPAPQALRRPVSQAGAKSPLS